MPQNQPEVQQNGNQPQENRNRSNERESGQKAYRKNNGYRQREAGGRQGNYHREGQRDEKRGILMPGCENGHQSDVNISESTTIILDTKTKTKTIKVERPKKEKAPKSSYHIYNWSRVWWWFVRCRDCGGE